MKKTFRERFIARCLNAGKKHTFLKIPMLICMTAFLSIYYVFVHFANNGKRYAGIAVAFLFFTVNSSFTFLVETEEQQAVKYSDEDSLEYQVALTSEQESADSTNVALIDDTEVLDGLDDVALLDVEELDTFTLDEILQENNTHIDKERKTDGEDVINSQHKFDKDDWRLILINKQHPIPEEYEFPLGTIKGSLQCDDRIIEDLLAMMQAAKDEGVDLVICSPYRDYNRQNVLFNRKITNYMNAGMSYMDAYKYASMSVTSPNASEHQVGLAIDFYSSTYQVLNEGFSETEAGIWLAANSCDYGFILRYPKGKEYITGIEYEPWHFRYVGVEAATVIMQQEIALEEFWEDL